MDVPYNLDGHLRFEVLKEIGQKEVFCLVSTDDEAFTYNHKVNRISPIQEHFMILRAIEKGVSEERIAKTLNVDVAKIRQKRNLLESICAEVVELLKDKHFSPNAIRVLKKMKPMRQIAYSARFRPAIPGEAGHPFVNPPIDGIAFDTEISSDFLN